MTAEATQSVSTPNLNKAHRLKPGPMLGTLRFLFRGVGAVAPKQMGKLAYRMWFTPRRLPRPEREKPILETPHEHYLVSPKNVKAVVRAWGHGPTVLMVHGWEGRGTQFSWFIESLVQKGLRVVTFDMPAHGDSEGKQTDLIEIEKVISQIAEKEGELHAVVAHSFGGVASAFAFRQGLKARKAVFMNSPSRFKTMLGFFQNELAVPDRVMKEMMACIEGRFPEIGERLWDIVDTAGNAAQFQFPGLIIHDRYDRMVPISQSERIAEAWKHATFEVTTGLGHHRILRDPAVIQRVGDFISGDC